MLENKVFNDVFDEMLFEIRKSYKFLRRGMIEYIQNLWRKNSRAYEWENIETCRTLFLRYLVQELKPVEVEPKKIEEIWLEVWNRAFLSEERKINELF